MSKNVLVAMSGGVDSSVSAYLLKQSGCRLTGVTMCLGVGADQDRKACCGRQAIEDARKICEALDIPHFVVDLSHELQEYVLNNFVKEYLSGRTPNPCVECNRYLKFGRLLEVAKALGFEYLATGHYAAIDTRGDRLCLKRPRDRHKDQTYFLYPIAPEDLRYILFPLGPFTKQETRSIAGRAGLPVAERQESQDLCFVANGDYGSFLSAHGEAAEPGPIVSVDGEVLGMHRGTPFYTVGQRRGLGISHSRPLYVVAIDREGNRIVAGEAQDLYAGKLVAADSNLFVDELPHRAKAQIRYRSQAQSCTVSRREAKLEVTFDEAQRAITPGQSVVLYEDDWVLGGGVIDSVDR